MNFASASPASIKSTVPAKHRKMGMLGALPLVARYFLLIILAISFFLPFYWMMSSALKDDSQVYTVPPIWIPLPSHWNNFADAWQVRNFNQYSINTIFRYSIPATIVTVISSAFIAYGFSRIKWPGRDTVFFICLATMMIPFQVMMVPLFIIFKNFGWINSYRPLIVPAMFGNAFFIFMLRQFFMGIPEELSDAARIDGCNELGILFRIILPLAKPALTVVALFTFIGSWNDYLGPLIYINKVNLYPIALGIQDLQRTLMQTGTNPMVYPHLMAVSTIITVPIIIFFFFAQRTFIEGIALTGIKG
jgi:multiple sugar transport system permease protein